MKLTVFSSDGKTSSEKDFANLPVFEGDKGLQAVKEVIVAVNANNRQGTHSTKQRGEVRGGGKKPWRQKGTGRARAGSTRSPLWVGGGVVFGPKPRDYSKKVNAKVRQLAFCRALFDRASAGELAVIEAFDPKVTKTKEMNAIVSLIAPRGRVLLVDASFAPETSRSSRNLARVSLQEAARLNTLDLAQHAKIIVTLRALDAILARANGGKN
jgi:large subunit ribosomal protein L4